VASVIRNRASERGQSPADVVRQKVQFTGYSGVDAATPRSYPKRSQSGKPSPQIELLERPAGTLSD
jgi:hypothetical protein